MDASNSFSQQEAQLIGDVAHQLIDIIRSGIPLAAEPQPTGTYETGTYETGIAQFDILTPDQQIVLVVEVVGILNSPDQEAPPRTAYRDAAIAAIYAHVLTLIEIEIDNERTTTSAEEDDTETRRDVAAAYHADTTCDPAACPDPECAVIDHWDIIVSALRDRVLPDEDFMLGNASMDLPPVASDELKENMGIHRDYFTAIPPDSTRQEARAAWARLCERTTGNRPALWRFDCQTRHLVTLADVTNAMEECPDEWSAYLNIETGKVAEYPNDLVVFIEEGDEDDEAYFGDWPADAIQEAKDFLKDWDSVKELPGKFEIHEWEVMREFSESLDEGTIRDDLLKAIRGSGAFRYFKDTLHRHGLQDQWFTFRDQAIEHIAINWLDQNDIPWER